MQDFLFHSSFFLQAWLLLPGNGYPTSQDPPKLTTSTDKLMIICFYFYLEIKFQMGLENSNHEYHGHLLSPLTLSSLYRIPSWNFLHFTPYQMPTIHTNKVYASLVRDT